jgi:hypothetical protein
MPHGPYGYYDNEGKEDDNVAYLHQRFVTHTGPYGYNGEEDANKTQEAENYYYLHGSWPTWYHYRTVVHHNAHEGKEENKTEAENYYRLHGFYPAWWTRRTVTHYPVGYYDNEGKEENKADA